MAETTAEIDALVDALPQWTREVRRRELLALLNRHARACVTACMQKLIEHSEGAARDYLCDVAAALAAVESLEGLGER